MNKYNNGNTVYTTGDIQNIIAERDNALQKLHSAQHEVEALQALNAELVAQVENLKSIATAAYTEWNYSNDVYSGMQRLMKAITATPTQCLRDVKAEVGRAGYQACLQNIGYRQDDANAYAARVKAGEV